MAQRYYDIDLTKGTFPFISKDRLRTTMATSRGYSTGSSTKPALLYIHNAMPSDVGYESVGYTERVAAVLSDITSDYFIDVRVVYDTGSNRKYLGMTSSGTLYVLDSDDDDPEWTEIDGALCTGIFDIDKVSIGNVQNVSYICYSYHAVFTLKSDNTLVEVELDSLDMGEVVGVIGSSGYLIAYTDAAVAWSSTIDPLDFDPSDVTGSGGGNVAGTAGDIIFASTNNYGFLLYTTGNVISAVYTGNSSYPFKFTPLANSAGGLNLNLITYKSNYEYEYSYTRSGIQRLTYNSAGATLPEVTDFLSGRVLEDFDEDTKEFSYTTVASLNKRLTIVASRYLIASYGLPDQDYYTHALVYDMAMEKTGKLKIDHVDIIDLNLDQDEPSRECIGIVGLDGSIKTVDFSASDTASGVIILGRLQYYHTNMIKLLAVDIENLAESDTLTVGAFPSMDGKNFDTFVEGYLLTDDDWVRKYGFMCSSKNVSLYIAGRFNLNTVMVTYALAGRR